MYRDRPDPRSRTPLGGLVGTTITVLGQGTRRLLLTEGNGTELLLTAGIGLASATVEVVGLPALRVVEDLSCPAAARRRRPGAGR